MKDKEPIKKDVVCGMWVDPSSLGTEYLGRHFAFCNGAVPRAPLPTRTCMSVCPAARLETERTDGAQAPALCARHGPRRVPCQFPCGHEWAL